MTAAGRPRDLSQFHHPVSEFLAMTGSGGRSPLLPEETGSIALSPEQIAFFEENGYLAGIRLLNERQIEWLREELSRLMEPTAPGHSLFHEFHSNESSDPSTVLFHALGAWRIEPGFHDLLWHPRFIRSSEQLLGGPVRFWHDQLFCKPAHHGGVVAWHQDYSYWTRTTPLAHLTCWIGLDDATRENGCLQYVPGSHRWPDLPITGLAGDMEAIRSVLPPELNAAFEPIAIELRAGECSFHHARTIHGSDANRTASPRRAVVLNLFRDGVCSRTNDPLLAGIPPIPQGEKLTGQFFPLLSVVPSLP
jgi:hypothetical protein